MSLGVQLLLVFLAFLGLIAMVMWFAFRERRLARAIPEGDLEAQRQADGRILGVVFGAAIGGLFLTLLTAWLVFF